MSVKNAIENSPQNRSQKIIENNTNSLPKWSRNQYQNSLKINARTGIETNHENHEISCFSERAKA
jgi:hypothetical protein